MGSTRTSPSISSLSASRFLSRLAQITKFAPADERVLAKCLPSPDEAPVIIAVFPVRSKISFIVT